MTQRFCDRCKAKVGEDDWQRVDVLEEPEADGSGSVNHAFDLCDTCADALHEFMRAGTLSEKGSGDSGDGRALTDVLAASGLPPLE